MSCRNVHRPATVRRLGLSSLSATIKKSGTPIMLVALWLCVPGSLPAQTFTTVFSFDGGTGIGSTPKGLVQGTDGNLYGITQSSNWTVFKITPSGTLTTLFTYNGLNNSGASPAGGLIQGTGRCEEISNSSGLLRFW
jgi:hypothetical protein